MFLLIIDTKWKEGKATYLHNIGVAFACSDFDSKVDKKM
jgi:hypothetical protein